MEVWARAFQALNRHIPRAIIHRQIGKGSNIVLDELLGDVSLNRQVNELHSRFYAAIQHEGYPLPGAKELIASLASQHIAV